MKQKLDNNYSYIKTVDEHMKRETDRIKTISNSMMTDQRLAHAQFREDIQTLSQSLHEIHNWQG